MLSFKVSRTPRAKSRCFSIKFLDEHFEEVTENVENMVAQRDTPTDTAQETPSKSVATTPKRESASTSGHEEMRRLTVVSGSCVPARFKAQMPSLIGVMGTTFMAVFISISSAIFAPFQCDAHPNGYQTVRSYPQIICWSTDYENGDKHTQMVMFGVIAAVVPFCFVTMCLWVVMQLPARMGQGDTAFLHTYAFLFFRFQPSAYWYVLVLLTRNLAAAMVPVVADEALQLLSLAIVINPCAVLCARALPWRIHLANMLDITTNMGFLLILFLAALHAEVLNESLIANMLALVLAFIIMIFSLVLLRAVYNAILRRGKKFQFFLCHHKQGGGGFTRLLKWRLKRDSRVRRGVFLDADNL